MKIAIDQVFSLAGSVLGGASLILMTFVSLRAGATVSVVAALLALVGYLGSRNRIRKADGR